MTIVVVRRQKRITMEGAASSINSRATAIKTILLAAWRAKLSNEEWESKIRKILPRGVNGDVYDLADCLLKQALVGPVPNLLFISYLKHAVQCELVSHGAVLSSIAHQSINVRAQSLAPSSAPNRTSSIICLLEFLKTFRAQISCKGTEIECLNLCHSLSQLIHWLLRCIQQSIETMLGVDSPNPPSNQQNINSATVVSMPGTGGVVGASLGVATPTTTPMPAGAPINLAQQETTIGIIDLCTETIHYFATRPFTKSLLFISRTEYGKEFEEILQTVQMIQHKLNNFPNLQFFQERVQHCKILQQLSVTFDSRDMHPSVVAAQQLRCLQVHRIRSKNGIASDGNLERGMRESTPACDSTTSYALFNSLYPLVAFDVVLRPTRSHKLLARQLATITNYNSAPIYMTYCELLRVCMIGLIDADGTPAKIEWVFFTFLKMPKLIIELNRTFKSRSNNHLPNEYSAQEEAQTNTSMGPLNSDLYATNPNSKVTQAMSNNLVDDLKLAFERLCEYSPLLDEAEYKCNCDFFKCLVDRLVKADPSLLPLKSLDLRKFPSKRQVTNNNDNSPVAGHVMLRTEPFVSSMLKTLDSEQDPLELFAFLSEIVTGKTFELTLSAAASTGRLPSLVKKLMEHNEMNKVASDGGDNQQIQALIFDITFLILTYIAQQYGPEVINQEPQSTFSKWFYECFHPATRINCPREMLKSTNGEVVSDLIKQIAHPETSIQLRSTNWGEVCCNLPQALHEILVAWSRGQLSEELVKLAAERIKSKLCFMAVVSATWLQCHIRILNEADRTRPLSLLQNLTKASQQAKQKQATADSSGLKNESYSQRSSLMCSIVRKIYFELVPKTTSSFSSTTAANAVSSFGSACASNQAMSMGANRESNGDEPNLDVSAYQSANDRFISILSTEQIFLANVKTCLSRGWVDHKSLTSLNSLFKMIGSECFTNLIVEQILTSHESPSDLNRAVNITFGLFHLDIEACAFALLRETIPSWLMGEKKQALLNQPRALALAHLAVMTIIEVFENLKLSSAGERHGGGETVKRLTANGIVQENRREIDSDSNSNGPKRIKLTHSGETDARGSSGDSPVGQRDIADRLAKLNECIADLMRLFREIMSDSVMSQRTLFPVLFLEQTVICTREGSSVVTVHLQPEILLDIINLFSSELTFELVLAISNLSNTVSRRFAAKATCQLAQVKEGKLQSQFALSHPPSLAAHAAQASNLRQQQQQQHPQSGSLLTSKGSTAPAPMLIE